MADEFQTGSGNWWESSSRNRFHSGSSPSSSALTSVGTFGWPTEIPDLKARSSMDSVSASGSSSMVFRDTHKLQPPDSAAGSGVLADSNLQMMGLSLSSHAMDWNPTLLRATKEERGFRSALQDDLNSSTNHYQQETGMGGSSQDQWREKIYTGSSEDSSANEYKQINRGFLMDHQNFSSSHINSGDGIGTCQGLTTSYQMDPTAYGGASTVLLHGLLASDSQQQPPTFENQTMNYQFPPSYGMNSGDLLPSSWSKFPQFLRSSPPKHSPHNQSQFSSNTPFWNASAAAPAMNDVGSSFFPPLQTQFPPTFDEKPNKQNTSEVQELSSVGKKSNSEPSNKRSRSDTPSPLPAAFKVRKEKMGDRITALQQLVSPFGKTDTASVLSEAIEYIKFLHEQVSVLSIPYMKSGTSMQHQKNYDKSKEPEGQKQDLRSRGLCLVPVSSTFPVTHETTVDFSTLTFGATYR
ncbi:hypothetical protein U1Q18_000578 [Sarracenia purpurea var. burkii]